MTANYNAELNGIELKFDTKPSETILKLLRSAGYRWHNIKQIWYAKQNEKTIKVADTLREGQIETSAENNVNDIIKTAYYPPYDRVGDEEIFKSSDIEIISHERINNNGGYFADINAHIHIFFGQVKITDLTNALTVGKNCKELTVNMSTRNDDIRCLCANKYKSFKNMYTELFVNRNFANYTVYENEEKAINTFTPFKEIQPIQQPEKWTTSHVWKAILSGQIYKGVKDGYYSDDYAQDYAEGYRTGRRLDLIKMAKGIIESNDGWSARVDKSEGKTAVLSFNCYSFDTNTLYFDEACNLKEAARREETDENERENYNKSMMAKVKDIKSENIKNNSVYTIQYLEMNDNTKKYEVKEENIQGSQLFYTDTIHPVDGDEYEKVETSYDIIEIEELKINDSTIYEISNFYDRPYFEKDNRIIHMGNWQNIVTGKGLKELITDGYNFPCIKESRMTTEQIKSEIKDHISGRKQWMFGVDKTDYMESYNRFNNELMRL